jgi:hypothetical protein
MDEGCAKAGLERGCEGVGSGWFGFSIQSVRGMENLFLKSVTRVLGRTNWRRKTLPKTANPAVVGLGPAVPFPPWSAPYIHLAEEHIARGALRIEDTELTLAGIHQGSDLQRQIRP